MSIQNILLRIYNGEIYSAKKKAADFDKPVTEAQEKYDTLVEKGIFRKLTSNYYILADREFSNNDVKEIMRVFADWRKEIEEEDVTVEVSGSLVEDRTYKVDEKDLFNS